MTPFLTPFLGGLCIGLAAALLWVASGRIAGISGIVGGLLTPSPDLASWRLAFVGGLLLGGLGWRLADPSVFGTTVHAPLPVVIVAGLVVGFGTRLGNGCTSGHGVCGLPRGSRRSLVATVTFMTTGAITVFVARHVVGAY